MVHTRIGILSDTHLTAPNDLFRRQAAACFAGCDMILHAGDLVDLSVLAVFGDRQVHAVHGNMCGSRVVAALPRTLRLEVGDFTIALSHGADYGYGDIETRLYDALAPVDCIVYGHTHRAVCQRLGPTLMINPGSFMATGRFGAAGTYAILEVGDTLNGRICEVPR